MRVPKSWKGVTVEQFQELLPIYKKAIEEKDSVKAMTLWANIIAILADCQTNEVEERPFDTFYTIKGKPTKYKLLGKKNKGLKDFIKDLSFLADNQFTKGAKWELNIDGIRYIAYKEAKYFNAARYTEFKTFLMNGSFMEQFHNLLACVYQPFDKNGNVVNQMHGDRVNILKKVSIEDVYGVVFFYTKAYKNSIRRIQEYGIKVLKEKQKEVDQHLMETLREILEDIGAGTLQSMNSQGETLLKRMS